MLAIRVYAAARTELQVRLDHLLSRHISSSRVYYSTLNLGSGQSSHRPSQPGPRGGFQSQGASIQTQSAGPDHSAPRGKPQGGSARLASPDQRPAAHVPSMKTRTRGFDEDYARAYQRFKNDSEQRSEARPAALSRADAGHAAHVTRPSERKAERKAKRRSDRFAAPRCGTSLEIYLKNRKTRRLLWGYVRHSYSDDELPGAKKSYTAWRQAFESIDTKAQIRGASMPEEADGSWLFRLENTAEMRAAWEALDEASRREAWPRAMLATLRFCPNKAHMVLDATLDPLPPRYAIHDVLLFMARHFDFPSLKSAGDKAVDAETMVDLLARLFEDLPPQYVPYSQRCMGLLARKLPAAQAKELFDILQRANVRTNANVLCGFASTFAKAAAYKPVSFGILKELGERGEDLNNPKFHSVVTSLLLGSRVKSYDEDASGGFSPRESLEWLIERGFHPNVLNLTALLSALGERGEVEEAIRLALLFAQFDIQLDRRAFNTIFRGAKASLVAENVVMALDVAKASNIEHRDVLNNALHAVLYFATSESRASAMRSPWIYPVFAPLARIYAKKFDLEPLQWWLPEPLDSLLSCRRDEAGSRGWEFEDTIVPAVDDIFSRGGRETRGPDSTTLSIMLRAYIRSLRDRSGILLFHSHFMARLREAAAMPGSEQARLIRSQGSLIHDTLMMVMMEEGDMFALGLELFDSMLKGSLKRAAGKGIGSGAGSSSSPPLSSSQGPDDLDLVQPAPSLFTFNILLRELFRRDEITMAKKLVRTMREGGIEPDLVTWNTILKGHATAQNAEEAVRTLQDLESAGLSPDVSTMSAFAKLTDQEKALKMMERIIEENKVSLAGSKVYY